MNHLISWQGLLDLSWLIFLLLLCGYFFQQRQLLTQAKNWKKSKGRITRFEWTEKDLQIWPKIQYTYQVFNQDYFGEELFLNKTYNPPSSKHARKVAYYAALAYEKDSDIDVYYDPNNPTQSVLDVKIPPKLNRIIALLLSLIILHLAVILHHLLK